MNYPIVTDIIHRIQNDQGKCIDVRPWPEAPSCVALMNSNKDSQEYFGNLELAMDTKFARHIGQALIACADEIEKKKD